MIYYTHVGKRCTEKSVHLFFLSLMGQHNKSKEDGGLLMIDQAAITIDRIQNVRIRFVLPLNHIDDKMTKKTISAFTYGDRTYLSIIAHPYVTIEIIEKGDPSEVKLDKTIKLPKAYFFTFLRKLNLFIQQFQDPNLFYVDRNRFLVNNDLAKKYTMTHLSYNKSIQFIHAIVRGETEGEDRPGARVAINRVNNYTLLSYDELCWMYGSLSNIDFTSTTLELCRMAYEIKAPKSPETDNIRSERTEEEIETKIPQSAPIVPPNRIPF